MIEQKDSVFRGPLNGQDVQTIQGRIIESTDFYLRSFKDPDNKDKEKPINDAWFKFTLTCQLSKKIGINRKNVELEDTFLYNDFRLTSVDSMKKLRAYGFCDIAFEFIVYRIGQHSYYTCDMHFVREVPYDENLGCCAG